MHLLDLSASVKEGMQPAGLVGYRHVYTHSLIHTSHYNQYTLTCTNYRFNTIGVSDGISMGTDGMSYSLQSRDIIAGTLIVTNFMYA